MSGLRIDIPVQDLATPVVRRLSRALESSQPASVAGRAVRNTLRSHLFAKNASSPNRLGGTRTNFYTKAGRAVQAPVISGQTATVSIAHPGIALRYFGGTVLPRVAKLLTIPADASAHGRRAREFRNLQAIFFRGGPAVGALVNDQDQVMYWLVKKAVQKPDPTVLPTDAQLTDDAIAELRAYFDRIVAREGAQP